MRLSAIYKNFRTAFHSELASYHTIPGKLPKSSKLRYFDTLTVGRPGCLVVTNCDIKSNSAELELEFGLSLATLQPCGQSERWANQAGRGKGQHGGLEEGMHG